MTATPGPSSAPVRMPPGFEFVRLLGRGGNGYVVCARQLDLDRLVAVKLIHGGTLAAGGLARLQREGRAIARLSHANVIRVYALVPMSEDLALVLEYVDGPTLEAAVGTLSVADTLHVLADIAAALEHCAGKGIVHRDLKPANVLLTADGRAKVADFGLSRLSRTAGAFRTSSGVVSGTPAYIAPEQVLDPDREHPAADAYSFAVVAYHALTGILPPRPAGMTSRPQLVDGLHPVAEKAFVRALCPDPSARLRPDQLLDRLRAVPAESWQRAASSAPRPPTGAGHETAAGNWTGRLDATAGDVVPAGLPAPVSAGQPVPPVEPAADVTWVDVPVYDPGRRRSWLRHSGALAGLLFGVVAVVIALLAR